MYTALIFRAIEEMKGVKIGGVNINNRRYADDTALLEESNEQLQDTLNKIAEEGEQFGMRIKVRKTKCMVISKEPEVPCILSLNGLQIEQVRSFTYLGQLSTENGNSDEEVKRSIAIAKSIFMKMKQTLCRNEIRLETRFRILKCYVWSTLLYGVETWTTSDTLMKKITAFEMWTYRRMLKISWVERKTNKEVLDRMAVTPQLERMVKTRKLKYFGHIVRHDSPQKQLLEGMVEGRRSRGRPRISWFSNVVNWTGMTTEEAKRCAQDRDRWRVNTSNAAKHGTQ